MARRICVIEGHPDPSGDRFCRALAEAYVAGAREAGHAVERIDVARLAPAPLASAADFDVAPDGPMAETRAAVLRAEHLVVIFPLWLGGMPARLTAFFEQLARAQFALGRSAGGAPEARLRGRSAHVVVTMGMPGLAYRLWFLNAGVARLKRLILGMAGVAPIRQTTIGGVEALSDAARRRRLAAMAAAGRRGR